MSSNSFKWKHFVGEIILLNVRWYLKYPLSYRNLKEMMIERRIQVDHSTHIFDKNLGQSAACHVPYHNAYGVQQIVHREEMHPFIACGILSAMNGDTVTILSAVDIP
jgi:hypothetical protein